MLSSRVATIERLRRLRRISGLWSGLVRSGGDAVRRWGLKDELYKGKHVCG